MTPMMSDLIQRRHAKGMSQQAIAFAAGLSVSTVQKFEGGQSNPSPRVARLLADAYGATIEEIYAAAKGDSTSHLAAAS
jgi:transcriptional regulator with XRE-family HTH domain